MVSFKHHSKGVDLVFDIAVRNTSNTDQVVRGRLVAISVYEANPANITSIDAVNIKAGEVATIPATWYGAPYFGRIRTLLVLSDGHADSLVSSSEFWLWPAGQIVFFPVGLAILAVLLLVAIRHRPNKRERVPKNMVSHQIEPGDSVVSLANLYGGTWQDIVKANRLKPPYDLKPGARIFIPKHLLQHPPAPSSTSTQP